MDTRSTRIAPGRATAGCRRGRSAIGHGAVMAALVVTALAQAAGPDEAALLLADEAPGLVERASDWRVFAEGAVGALVRRSDGATRDARRLALDIRYDHAFTPDWRFFLANRLDMAWPEPGGEPGIHTLKEAYATWRMQPETLLDLGRINVRNGVAMGYNPTDFFRAGALRSIVSISPASLRENRQGSLMLRGQRLWEDGSLTWLYSPELSRRSSPEGFNLDPGATNSRHRALVAVSQKVSPSLSPQFLIYREQALPTQFGLNLTGLINDATVAHLEWSGGRGPSLLARALPRAAPGSAGDPWQNRLAAGLTYTTPNNISLTAEYHYSGGGLDETGWAALRQGPLPLYGQYRNWLRTAQEQPTRQAFFFHGVWQDALVSRLDLSVMYNRDLIDASHRLWLEARYHREKVEYALQWQMNGGQPLSAWGALPESRGWQAVLRCYL